MRYYRCGNCGSRLEYFGGGADWTRCPECAEKAEAVTIRKWIPEPTEADRYAGRVWSDPDWVSGPDWYRPAIVRKPTRWRDVGSERSGGDPKIWVPGKPAVYEFELYEDWDRR